ncbi:MAG TPA: protein kinase, partial [Gemmatimonadales bacterium]|nr:protein kinase [Gemmatimonadales bacterium]
MSRDKLIAYLWPERDAEAGRHSLSQTLYAIRQDLGGDLLVAGVDDIRLNAVGLTCDVWEFEDSLTAGKPERAVALYTGPFLDGFYINDAEGFERWAESERRRLVRVYEETIERLARIAAEQGALLQAAGWWERRAALDPLDSRVAVALMNALAAGGNRAGALRHAQLHASLLERELGAGPNPAVQALAERLAEESGIQAGHSSPTPAERNEEHRRRLGIALGSRYRLERELGSGGMATVYLAEDIQHQRRVAVKVLKPEISDRFGSDRFLREIGIAARLEHPHILPLFDSGRLGPEVDSGFYYVTPYVAGNSLRHRLGREHQLPIDEAVRITCEIAGALAHAHSHGIVHRDIKPENVLLQDGSVLVADFGLARALDAVAGERLTQSGVAVGTPHYMSPEQASASPELDGRSDIYALGCVLYEMLAGEPPFGGTTAQAILARHAIDQVPRLRTVRPTIPLSVERAVLKALAKVPADRFATAAQFADALTRPSEVPGPVARLRSRPARLFRRAAAIALLAAGSIGGWLALRPAGPRVMPSASVIAVLPFEPSAPDSLLSRLGQDLSLTISANLDGIGEVRAVDPRTLLAQPSVQGRPLSLRQAAALGRQFGAGSVLHGTLARIGGVIRLDVALHRSDISATDSGPPLARLYFSSSPDSMASLSDSITRYLLRQIWRRGEAPSPSLDAALRTRSVPALGAFLEGERRLVTNRWKEAADAYRRAVDADSTFWLAQWRRGFVHYWLNGRTDSALTRVYWKHRNELPERERLLIEALETDSLSTRLDLLRRATDQAPDSWIAWLLYGDALIHGGPLLGHSRQEARRAFSRAVGA